MIAPLPSDEEARLQALSRYEVMDTPPEAAFDRITNLAARLFRVPVALVTLMGSNRQWMKSRHGVDICEIGRDQAFCSYTVLADEVLVVPDATKDPRFADNPLVTHSPFVRFYAGAPLRSSDGFNLGSLCIIDTIPHAPLSLEECATLRDLAAAVMDSLELRLVSARARKELDERRHAEDALRQSEARFRSMAANTPGMVYQFVLRPDGTFYFPFVSEGCRDIYGVGPQAIYDNPGFVLEVVAPADHSTFNESITRSAKTLEPWAWEGRVELAPGCVRWLQGFSRPERLSTGDIHWDGVLVDITERKRAEEEAVRSARRVQTILESITDAFFSVDRDWRFTYINDQAERLLARSREQLLGGSLWEEFPGSEDSTFRREYRRAMATGQPVAFEEFYSPLETCFDVHAYPSEEGLAVYFQDISARKRAQRQLEDSHKLLHTIIESTEDAIYVKDRESRYLLINSAGAKFMGRKPEEIVGLDDTALFSPETARSTMEYDRRVMDTGRSHTYEDGGASNGVERTYLSTKCPFRNADGETMGVIGLSRDITERRVAEEALRAAKVEAERANAAKSEFLSRMSHELRTPLNAILGFGQLLEMGNLETRQKESTAYIIKAGRHLLELINEILEISRIEAGRLHLSMEPVAIESVARECLSLIGQLAEGRKVQCEAVENEALSRFVQADRQRLRQVLLNLFSNAVKYNRDGGRVTFSCREIPALLPSEGAAVGRLRMEVIDTGFGVSAEDISKLFVPFERLGAERTSVEGSGLGLALSKRLVEAMSGCLGVDSVPGEGSAFWIELPLAECPLARLENDALALPSMPVEAPLHKSSVLYIEDNLSNLRLIEFVLARRPGIELLSAMQGELGLEMARSRKPDLILLDLHLPDVPGWDVLLRLRADPVTRDIPVIIISADATSRQVDRLMQSGARVYLTKPIDVTRLLEVLEEHLKPASGPVLSSALP